MLPFVGARRASPSRLRNSQNMDVTGPVGPAFPTASRLQPGDPQKFSVRGHLEPRGDRELPSIPLTRVSWRLVRAL